MPPAPRVRVGACHCRSSHGPASILSILILSNSKGPPSVSSRALITGCSNLRGPPPANRVREKGGGGGHGVARVHMACIALRERDASRCIPHPRGALRPQSAAEAPSEGGARGKMRLGADGKGRGEAHPVCCTPQASPGPAVRCSPCKEGKQPQLAQLTLQPTRIAITLEGGGGKLMSLISTRCPADHLIETSATDPIRH